MGTGGVVSWAAGVALALGLWVVFAAGICVLLASIDNSGRQGPRPYHAHWDGRRNRPCYASPCALFDAEQERAA